jgi:hypothetical protein
MPEFLETILDLRRSFSSCSVFATEYWECLGGQHHRRIRIRGLPSAPWKGVIDDYFRIAVISDPPVCSSAVAVTRTAIDAVGGFPAGIPAGEDLLTWARLAVRFQIAYSRTPMAVFHQETDRYISGPVRRRPCNTDQVGRQLRELLPLASPSVRRPLRRYIAHWHRIRSSDFIGLGERWSAVRELVQGLRMNPFQWKLYRHMVVAVLPQVLQRMIGTCHRATRRVSDDNSVSKL